VPPETLVDFHGTTWLYIPEYVDHLGNNDLGTWKLITEKSHEIISPRNDTLWIIITGNVKFVHVCGTLSTALCMYVCVRDGQ
jgi:hypothetical protein